MMLTIDGPMLLKGKIPFIIRSGGMLKEYLVSNTPWTERQIKIKNINVSNKIILPENWGYHITPAPRSSMIGRSAFLLDITNEDNSIQSSWVSADIEVWVDVSSHPNLLKKTDGGRG